MKSSITKRIKIIGFAVLFILLAVTIYSGKVEATDSINCYVAKKYEGEELKEGDTFFVVKSNIDSEVYITESIADAKMTVIAPSGQNYYASNLYAKKDSSLFFNNVNVTDLNGLFDGCELGCLFYKNDENIIDNSTNENLSGAKNEYVYYCAYGGAQNYTVFLFKSLSKAEITSDNITVEQKSEFEKGDIPTADDFKVTVKIDDTEYVLGSASNTDNPYYVIVDPKGIEEGENTVKILVYDTFEKEITVKPKEDVVEPTPEVKEEVKEEKDETPKTGTESDSILFLSIIATISLAGICINGYKNEK